MAVHLKNPIYVKPYSGIGDTIYIRPFVEKIAEVEKEVYISTPWPTLYAGIEGLKFLRPDRDYRTQYKNIVREDKQSFQWSEKHPHLDGFTPIQLGYSGSEINSNPSIMRALQTRCPKYKLSNYGLTLPPVNHEAFERMKSKAKWDGKTPLALVRPVTIRAEWEAPARATLPEYVKYCAEQLTGYGYHVVSVADTVPKQEWIVPPAPYASVNLVEGELTIDELVEITRISSAVVGGIGWIVPMAIASRVPLFALLGGQGAYNQPSKLTDATMDTSKVFWGMPDKLCRCDIRDHKCHKVITNINEQFHEFLTKTNPF